MFRQIHAVSMNCLFLRAGCGCCCCCTVAALSGSSCSSLTLFFAISRSVSRGFNVAIIVCCALGGGPRGLRFKARLGRASRDDHRCRVRIEERGGSFSQPRSCGIGTAGEELAWGVRGLQSQIIGARLTREQNVGLKDSGGRPEIRPKADAESLRNENLKPWPGWSISGLR